MDKRVFVYVHNGEVSAKKLSRLPDHNEEVIELLKEAGEGMYDIGDYRTGLNNSEVRLITMTPAPLSSDGVFSLLEELRQDMLILSPGQSVFL